jgi:hypothetical protein
MNSFQFVCVLIVSHSSHMFFFFSLSYAFGKSRHWSLRIDRSNGIVSLLAQQDPPIDRSLMHIIIFTHHDAVQCIALAHLIFLKQQLFNNNKKNKAENKVVK